MFDMLLFFKTCLTSAALPEKNEVPSKETVILYLWISLALALVTYLLEVGLRFRDSRPRSLDKFEEVILSNTQTFNVWKIYLHLSYRLATLSVWDRIHVWYIYTKTNILLFYHKRTFGVNKSMPWILWVLECQKISTPSGR